MAEINYSVIIPHKNRQNLLQRCIESLPKRDDMQVIIVDDKSDPNIVDFKHLYGFKNSHTDVILTNKGKGAGYARNIGLDHAKGKWILFADSDDIYLDNLSEVMNQYVDSKADMVIFKLKTVDSNGIEIPSHRSSIFDNLQNYDNYDHILYKYYCPVGRFIKRSIIESNHIRFQEVKYSNDVLFAIRTALASKNVVMANTAIYCVYEYPNSLVRNNRLMNYIVRSNVALQSYTILSQHGKGHLVVYNWEYWWKKLYKKNRLIALVLWPKAVLTLPRNASIVLGDSLKKDFFSLLRTIKK